MAQAANYYYNSPYIADIGRNLASALAPPDPEKKLAIQQSQFALQHAQTEEAYQQRERQRNQLADEKMFELVSMEPEIDPTTGKINEDLTDMKARRLFGEILQIGGRDYYKDASSAAGTASPQFAAQEALKQMSINAASTSLGARLAQQLAMQQNGFDFRNQYQQNDQTWRSNENEKNRQLRRDIEASRQQARIAQIALQNEGKVGANGKKWHSPPKNIINEITWGFEDIIEATGKNITPEDKDRLIDEGIAAWQASGNPKGAVIETFTKRFPGVTTYSGAGNYGSTPVPPANTWGERFNRFFGGGPQQDNYLHPNFGDATLPAQAPTAAPTAPPDDGAPLQTPASTSKPKPKAPRVNLDPAAKQKALEEIFGK